MGELNQAESSYDHGHESDYGASFVHRCGHDCISAWFQLIEDAGNVRCVRLAHQNAFLDQCEIQLRRTQWKTQKSRKKVEN